MFEDSENELKNDIQEEEKEKKEKTKVIIKDERKPKSDFLSRQEAIKQVLKYQEEKISLENDKRKWGNFTEI